MTKPTTGQVLPMPGRVRPHSPTAHEINADRLRSAARAAWNDGYHTGFREAFTRARTNWLLPGLVLGAVVGALVRHALGPLQ